MKPTSPLVEPGARSRRALVMGGMKALALSLVVTILGAGCTTALMPTDEIVATSGREVQTKAWEQVQRLVAVLDRVDATKNPGVAALVKDLNAAMELVNVGEGGNFEALDTKTLISENPHFWRATLEVAAGDGALPTLEGLLYAAEGEIDHADDLLELVRAGPLMDESLDRVVSLQRSLISGWRMNSPSLDVMMSAGLPAQERWQPLKSLQARYPDSPTVAMATLRMRTELAGVELTGEGENERMRTKVLEAEPQAMAVLETSQPLWAAIIKATGESGDAAKRLSEMLTADNTGVLNLSAKDFSTLIADFMRVGLPDWALRAVRLRMAEAGGRDQADAAVVSQLLPMVLGAEAAAPILADWEKGTMQSVAIFSSAPEPQGRLGYPMEGVVGGHYERRRRAALAILEQGAPTPEEERLSWLILAESERELGNLGQAAKALDHYDSISTHRLSGARERLALASMSGDAGLVVSALEGVKKEDRRLRETHAMVGIAQTMLGNYAAAADAFAQGFENTMADPERRAWAALHAYGAGKLAGETRTKMLEKALTLVDEDVWIASLLAAMKGDRSVEELMGEAAEGRDYLTTGKTCEAHFALAFAPGETAASQRMHLEACVRTGMTGYIEFDTALMWLRRIAPQEWPVPVGDPVGLARGVPPSLDDMRPRQIR